VIGRPARLAATLLGALALAGCGALGGPAGPPQPEAATGAPAFAAPAPGPPAHVLLVTVAGLTPRRYLEAGGGMPVLAGLARAGAAADRVEPVAPPAAYPVHATYVTGRAPRGHAVTADRLLGDHGVRQERFTHASYVQGPTLWDAVVASGGSVASLDWPATVGARIPLLLPDLASARDPRGQDVLAAASPWLRDLATESAVDLARPSPARDAFLVSAACTLLASPAPPRLLLLRLTQTEPVLEARGPFAAQADAAFAGADAALGDLVGCLEDAGRLAESALVVAGDRAVLPVHTAVAPNRVLADAGLVASDARGVVSAWRAIARSNGGSAFVYAVDAESALAARRALEAAADETGVFRLVTADEMIARSADPEAWFGLEADPGFALVDAAQGPLLAPAPVRGAGGYLAAHREEAPGLVAFGRGVRDGLRIPALRQVDVAPTLARLLGVELPQADGRAFVGLLALGPAVTAPAPDGAAPGADDGARWRVEVEP
jgi:hypothetical protein